MEITYKSTSTMSVQIGIESRRPWWSPPAEHEEACYRCQGRASETDDTHVRSSPEKQGRFR